MQNSLVCMPFLSRGRRSSRCRGSAGQAFDVPETDPQRVVVFGQVCPVPVLILHGLDDPIVQTHHGRMLFAAAREPKQLWLTATPGHIQSFADEKVRQAVLQYLDQHLKSPAPTY